MPSAWQVEDLLPAIWGFAQAASGLGEHSGLVVHPWSFPSKSKQRNQYYSNLWDKPGTLLSVTALMAELQTHLFFCA